MPNHTDKWTYTLTLTPSELSRFWSKVDRGGADECWPWIPPIRDGYGSFAYRGTSVTAHRASYLIHRGPIPDGLVIDHLCRNRSCVNPDHLEPVTPKTNSRRSPLVYKEACSRGHDFSEFGFMSGEHRFCQICHNERSKLNQRRYRRQRGAVPFAERTHCGKGHELTPDNIKRPSPSRPNQRECRICANTRARDRYARVGR